MSTDEAFSSLLTPKNKAKTRKAVKRTPDPDKQPLFGKGVVKDFMFRIVEDIGSNWIAENNDGIDGICEAVRVLLLDLGFSGFVADVASCNVTAAPSTNLLAVSFIAKSLRVSLFL